MNRCVCIQVCGCSGVCATDQSTEPLRWVSTGDAGGVNSDLHHFLHVGGRRLTGVELPSRPPLRATQRATHFKRSRGLTVAWCWQVEQCEDEAAQVGGHVGPTGSPSGRHTWRPLPYFNPPLKTCFWTLLFPSSWLPGNAMKRPRPSAVCSNTATRKQHHQRHLKTLETRTHTHTHFDDISLEAAGSSACRQEVHFTIIYFVL